MSSSAVLLAASHGTSDRLGQRAVAALVHAVSEFQPGLSVVPAFVDVQQPDVPSTLVELGRAMPVVIVPLLLSAGYHVRVDLARAAALASNPAVVVAAALGPDERITRILARRLHAAKLRPDDVIVLAAAGSSDHRAVEDCRTVAGQLAQLLGQPVSIGFISAAEPRLPDAVRSARLGGRRVVIASYLLAPGYFAGLAHAAGADVVTEPLLPAYGAVPVELVEAVVDRYLAACNADVSAPLHPDPARVTTP